MPRRSAAERDASTGPPSDTEPLAGQRAPADQAAWALAILHAAADGILTINERGIVQWMNPAAEALFCYSSDDVVGRNVKMLMPPPYRDQHDSYIADYVRTGQKKVIGLGREVIGQRKDGTTFPMYLSVSESIDNGSRIFGGILHDLSREKRTEHELRTLAALVEASDDAIIRKSLEGMIQSWNPGAERLLGYSAEEALGRHISLVVPPERMEELQAVYAALQRGERVGSFESVRRTKDNHLIDVSITISAIRNEHRNVVGFSAIQHDISRRMHALEGLRRERDFSRRLLDTAEAIILVLDAQGRIVQFNRHMEQLAGRPLHDVREHDWFETFVPERDRARTRWQFKQTVAGRGVKGMVYPILVRGGEERQVEWFESALEHGEGRAGGLLCIGLDVTERIEAEAERHIYEEKLRSLSAELAATEERERHDLAVELHDRIGQTLALTKIKLGGLREAAPAGLRARVSEIRDLVDQAVQSSRALMMELGAMVLHELGLEAALAGLTDEIQKRHGTSCMFVDDKQPKPLADQTKVALFRAVRELLMNVIKHAAAKRVEVSVERLGSNLRIRVRDDGAGFVVPTEGFHAKREGGFGLFSIQERLARLGGELRLISTPGAGTTATLEAPLTYASEQKEAT